MSTDMFRLDEALYSARLLMKLKMRLRFVSIGLNGDFALLDKSYKRIIELEKQVAELETRNHE